MSSSPFFFNNATKVVLFFLAAAGYYTTWYFFSHNGTANHLAYVRQLQLLPGTQEPLRAVYTGLPALDDQLTVLTLFFWEIVNGSTAPSASLFCFYFATQLACGWGLLVLEGSRHGNRWTLVSFIGSCGIVMQNAAFAVIVPIWCIAHLSLSPTVSSRRLSDHMVTVPDLAGISFAMLTFYLLLSIVMSFPAPSVLTHDLKQWLLAFWQFFPVSISLGQATLSYLLSITGLGDDPTVPSNLAQMRWMRPYYAALLTGAALGQAKTLALMWTSAYLPGLFADDFVGVFNFPHVFLPASTSPYTRMPSLAAGAFLLLQYDYFIASIALILWGTALFTHTYRNGTIERRLGVILVGGFIALIVTGPMGVATAFVWARDELLVAEAGDGAGARAAEGDK